MASNTQPADSAIRHRFASEIEINFSVGSPAGSGKTHSLTERVASYASHEHAEKYLPQLVVVTFAEKSAEEMQSRARDLLLSRGVSAAIQNAFSRSFFGTIHSFAVDLLRSHGHLIGVPSSFEVVADTDKLWYDFLRDSSWGDHAAANPAWARVLRHIALQDVLAMASRWDATRSVPPAQADAPTFNFGEIYRFPTPKRADTAANIVKAQELIRKFEKAATNDAGDFAELPMIDKGGKEFIALVNETLLPVARWLQAGAANLAGELFFAFREWRIRRGVLSYDDQVSLAAKLLQHPEGKKAIRRRGFRIILDEAQDTDPQQFDLLLNSVLPADIEGSWRDGVTPEPGRFSMVGDPQQSIYGSRADLSTYRAVHKYLTNGAAGESLEFSVTFRCDESIIAAANAAFPSVLDGQSGQVPYVKLSPRPDAGKGQVVRLEIPAISGEEEDLIEHEAAVVAQFIANHGPSGLRAANWGEIALLVPRTKWFLPLRAALLRHGIRSTLLSQADYNYDSPAYLWLTALSTIFTDPRNGFEIVGVLRDLYGISDRDLGFYGQGRGSVWQIAEPSIGEGPVVTALNDLSRVRLAVLGMPLRQAIAQIDSEILRPRLRSLPVNVYGDLDSAMVPLLATASAMEASNADLRQFATHLRDNLDSKPEISRESPECVNILTNLKSKGLQWDCVVLPFFSRRLSVMPPRYPALVGERHTPAQFAFSKDDAAPFASREEVAAQQELERILYVSITRPKQTLVLVDDLALFAANGLESYSLAGAMKTADDNQTFFRSLPTSLSLPAIAGGATTTSVTPVVVDIAKAVATANQFPRKLTPHSLREDAAEPGARTIDRLRSHTASDAISYGIWWHDTMRTIKWAHGRAEWQNGFAAALTSCPLASLAVADWNNFLASDFSKMFEEVGVTILVEVPFMIQAQSGNAIEGIMDIAIHRPGRGWLVADWKTGRSRTSAEDLLADYGTQVRLYRDAVAAMTDEAAEGLLYSTATGLHVAA